MRCKLFYSLLLLFALTFGGCEQEDAAEEIDEGTLLEEDQEDAAEEIDEGTLLEEDSENTTITLDPIAHFSFDTDQDDSEVDKKFQELLIEKSYESYATTTTKELNYVDPFIAKIGETYVKIKTKTGTKNIPERDAKSDSKVTFKVGHSLYYGKNHWNGLMYIVFNLDNPDKNDREKGSVDYFYYKVDYDYYSDIYSNISDILAVRVMDGIIKIHGSDGWYCDYVRFDEYSWKFWNSSKTETGYLSHVWEVFDFNAWVDTDDTASRSLLSTNRDWLQVNVIP